jgi:hypothetical protein
VAPLDPEGAQRDAAELPPTSPTTPPYSKDGAPPAEGAQPPEAGEGANVPPTSLPSYSVEEAERDLRDLGKAVLRVPALVVKARRGQRPDLTRIDGTADRIARAAAPRALHQGGWLFWAGMVAAAASDLLDDMIDAAIERANAPQPSPNAAAKQTVDAPRTQLTVAGGAQ